MTLTYGISFSRNRIIILCFIIILKMTFSHVLYSSRLKFCSCVAFFECHCFCLIFTYSGFEVVSELDSRVSFQFSSGRYYDLWCWQMDYLSCIVGSVLLQVIFGGLILSLIFYFDIARTSLFFIYRDCIYMRSLIHVYFCMKLRYYVIYKNYFWRVTRILIS